MKDGLAGKRILVVEDEFLVAEFIKELLDELDAVPVGPACQLEEGLSLARRERVDAAVLDVNLNGTRSDPIAEILEARGIPYALSTGYGEAAGSDGVPVLTKPYTMEDLADCLHGLVAGE